MPRHGDFVPAPEGVKKNPNSLRYVFKMIREKIAKETQSKFAMHLNKVGQRYDSEELESKTTVQKLETNKGLVKYLHIEKYAAIVHQPILGDEPDTTNDAAFASGALLLFSRMLANKRDGFSKESNERLAQQIIEIMSEVSDQTAFDHVELNRWAAVFRQSAQ